MQDVQDEPLFAERVAGLDIAKAEVEVTLRVPSETTAGRRQQETRTYGTTRRELDSLADWLHCWAVTRAGMEATGDYWKPVFFLLESRGFDCQLYNAGQVKALPGRPKTDRADSIWLAKITERGSVASSFVPPEPVRRLRTHTRYRRHLTQARTAEKQRVEKLLEDGHLKLSSVISDIHGVSGRAMLEALAAGQRDAKALAQLARGTMRGKIRRLEEALDCSFFTAEHAAVLAMMLAAIDCYTAPDPGAHRQDRDTDRALPAPGGTTRRDRRHRGHLRPGHHRRDRRRYDGVPHRLPPGLLGQMVTPGQAVGRETQRQQRDRPRQPLPGCRPRRSRHLRRPHAILPRRQIPAADQTHAQKESPRRHRQLHAHHHPRATV